MEDGDLLIFEFEVKRLARLALRALESLEMGALSWSIGEDELDRIHDRHALGAWGFLSASANISKILWPGRKSKLPERGPLLRAIFEVPDDSPLRPRAIRDRVEHHDEDLEKDILYPSREGGLPVGAGLQISWSYQANKLSKLSFSKRGATQDMTPVVAELSRIHSQFSTRVVGNRIYLMQPELEKYRRTGQ